MDTRCVVLASAVLCAISGCSRHRSDEEALRIEQFSPEAGRGALLNLIRTQPATFVNRREAAEDAQKELIALGNGRFKLGSYVIDVTKREYGLAQIPGPGSGKTGIARDWHDYHGFFEYLDGCWVAQPPKLAVRLIQFSEMAIVFWAGWARTR